MKWDKNDFEHKLVYKSTSWLFIHDFLNFKDGYSVFIFADTDHTVMYIGTSNEEMLINAIIDAMEDGKDYGASLILTLYTKYEENSELLTNELIDKYMPPNNNLNIINSGLDFNTPMHI